MACLRAVPCRAGPGCAVRPRLRAAECSPRAPRSTGSGAALFVPPGALRPGASPSYQMLVLRPVCAVGNAQRPYGGARSALEPIMCTEGRAFAGTHLPSWAARAPSGGSKFAQGSPAEHLTGWLPRGEWVKPPADCRSCGHHRRPVTHHSHVCMGHGGAGAYRRRLRVEGLGALQAPKRRQRDALLIRKRDRRAEPDAEAGGVLVDDDPPDLLAEVGTGVRARRLL